MIGRGLGRGAGLGCEVKTFDSARAMVSVICRLFASRVFCVEWTTPL